MRVDPLFRAGLVLGLGLGGFADGIVLHQILGIHHVLPGSPVQFLADMLFLASGVLGIVIDWLMARPPAPDAANAA